jgi:hypothetical protein
MPLFGNRPGTDATTWEPQAADSRLAQTAGADPAGVFTSDLSVAEYVLLGEAGFEPLGFVVGSSIYHVGLQVGRWSQNQELQVLTQAMYSARELGRPRHGVSGHGHRHPPPVRRAPPTRHLPPPHLHPGPRHLISVRTSQRAGSCRVSRRSSG